MRLEHAMLSHHGELEWGSPKRPSTFEALLLHHVDNLDAKAAGFVALLGGGHAGRGVVDRCGQPLPAAALRAEGRRGRPTLPRRGGRSALPADRVARVVSDSLRGGGVSSRIAEAVADDRLRPTRIARSGFLMTDTPRAEIGVFGGSGFYELLDNPREHKVNTPLRRSVVAGHGRRDRGPLGRVSSAPRQGPFAAAAHDQLPREPLGDEGARRDADHRPERVRLAAAGGRAGALRHLRPVRRPHVGSQGHVLRWPITTHVSSADPYCPTMRQVAVEKAASSESPRTRPGPSWSSRVRASRRDPSRSGSPRRAGRSST